MVLRFHSNQLEEGPRESAQQLCRAKLELYTGNLGQSVKESYSLATTLFHVKNNLTIFRHRITENTDILNIILQYYNIMVKNIGEHCIASKLWMKVWIVSAWIISAGNNLKIYGRRHLKRYVVICVFLTLTVKSRVK